MWTAARDMRGKRRHSVTLCGLVLCALLLAVSGEECEEVCAARTSALQATMQAATAKFESCEAANKETSADRTAVQKKYEALQAEYEALKLEVAGTKSNLVTASQTHEAELRGQQEALTKAQNVHAAEKAALEDALRVANEKSNQHISELRELAAVKAQLATLQHSFMPPALKPLLVKASTAVSNILGGLAQRVHPFIADNAVVAALGASTATQHTRAFFTSLDIPGHYHAAADACAKVLTKLDVPQRAASVLERVRAIDISGHAAVLRGHGAIAWMHVKHAVATVRKHLLQAADNVHAFLLAHQPTVNAWRPTAIQPMNQLLVDAAAMLSHGAERVHAFYKSYEAPDTTHIVARVNSMGRGIQEVLHAHLHRLHTLVDDVARAHGYEVAYNHVVVAVSSSALLLLLAVVVVATRRQERSSKGVQPRKDSRNGSRHTNGAAPPPAIRTGSARTGAGSRRVPA